MASHWYEVLEALGLEPSEIDGVFFDLRVFFLELSAKHYLSKDQVAEALRAYADWIDPPEHLRSRIEQEKNHYGRLN